MKTIKVQKDCVVDRRNIAKVKQREIALSVTSIDALNGNESGFINFTLGIEDCQLSLEFFGTCLLKEKKQDLFYVDRIELDVDLAEEELKNINKEFQEKFSHGDVICAKVYDDREKVIATAIAFNQHSGYYAHSEEQKTRRIIMKRKIELLSKMVEELNGTDGSSYNDLMVSDISDLCERCFPEDPYEAARAVYFGKINNWGSHFMRIDGNGNIEEITEQAFNEEILGEQEEIMSNYLENFGEDEMYLEIQEIIENEDSED